MGRRAINRSSTSSRRLNMAHLFKVEQKILHPLQQTRAGNRSRSVIGNLESVRRAVSRTVLAVMLLSSLAGLEWGRRHWVAHDLVTWRTDAESGRLASARWRLRRAAGLAPGAPEPKLALAELELLLGNHAAVESRLAALLARDLTVDLRARALTAVAQVDLFRGRHASARRGSHQALTAARASGRPEIEARALLLDSGTWIGKDTDALSTLAALERARELAIESGHTLLRAWADTEIGYVRWWYLREVDDPVPGYFDPALETFRRAGDVLGEAYALDHIANAWLRADDLIAFFEVQEQALRIWEDVDNRARQAGGHLQLGWVWDRLENPRRAHHHLERSLELARETGYELLVPRIQRYLAAVEHSSGRSERAAARLESLLAEARPWSPESRSIHGVLGDARRRLGEQAAARAAYKRATELDQAKDPSFRVWIGSGLARTALAEGDLTQAEELLAELEGLIGPRADWSDRRRVLLLRAAVLEADAGSSSALAPLLEAAEFETRSLGSVGSLTVDHGLGVLRRLLPRLLASDAPRLWAAEAFRFLEQARLRPVRQRQLTRLGPPTHAAAAGEREALLAARQASGIAAATPSPQNLRSLRNAYAHYETEVLRARSTKGLSSGGRAATVAEIQHRLSPTSVVVAYVLTRRITVALVLRSDRFDVVPLNFRPADLRPRIKVLRHQLAAGQGRGWRSPARELGRLLLGPLEAAGSLEGSDRLLVVPMGELHEVPFAVLLDEAGRPLIERVAVAMLPAASVLMESSPRSAGSALVVGRESFRDFGWPDLPAARRETQAITQASNGRQLFGPALSESAFRQLAADASRLHIVTHAHVEPEMPMLSRLILAPPEDTGETATDGELTVRELLDLEIRAELVTLSACRSGLALPASRRPRVELRRTGLVEGFLLAGARNVLGTLFPVEDGATADFMVAFEEELRQRQPIDALATVQRALASGDGSTAHPGHWAAFVLAGPGTWSTGPLAIE